jgi:hypothetical protein
MVAARRASPEQLETAAHRSRPKTAEQAPTKSELEIKQDNYDDSKYTDL